MSRGRVIFLTVSVVIILLIIAVIVYFLFFHHSIPGPGGPCPSSTCGLINNNDVALNGEQLNFALLSTYQLWLLFGRPEIRR